VIDDEADIRESLEVLLTMENYQVDLAPNATEGQRKIETGSYDLILLDLMMPDRSGMDVLRDVRERDTETPIFMITSYGSIEVAVAALKNGANAKSKEYIQEKLRSAVWLIRSIHQRQRTIVKVTDSIIKFQREFLDKGIAHLKPLILRDVAEDIGMHESTVSRVTTAKYVHTPQGIFELKYFFNSRQRFSRRPHVICEIA